MGRGRRGEGRIERRREARWGRKKSEEGRITRAFAYPFLALDAVIEMSKQNMGDTVLRELQRSKNSPFDTSSSSSPDFYRSLTTQLLHAAIENSISSLNCSLDTLSHSSGSFVIRCMDLLHVWILRHMKEREEKVVKVPSPGSLMALQHSCVSCLEPWVLLIHNTAKSVVSLEAPVSVLQWIHHHRPLFSTLLSRACSSVSFSQITDVIDKVHIRVAQLEFFNSFCLMCTPYAPSDLLSLRTALEQLKIDWLSFSIGKALSTVHSSQLSSLSLLLPAPLSRSCPLLLTLPLPSLTHFSC